MSNRDLVDDYQINVEFHGDHILDIPQSRRRKPQKQWYKVRQLGRGGFGTVWLERLKDNSSIRAVKEVPKTTKNGPPIDFTRELLAMAKFSKYEDYFIKFFGWFENDETVFIAMEYVEHGDLLRYIKPPIPENETKLITSQVLEGLAIMHKNHFTHRDLKPENIFVVERGPYWWVKIGDFGITKRIESEHTALRTQAGTQQYQAPEIVGYTTDSEGSSEYTEAVDMWSLGCVVYTLLTSEIPFPMNRNLLQFCQGTAKFPVQRLEKCGVSEEGIVFLKTLISPRARDRPESEAALKSKWLSSIEIPEVGNPPADPTSANDPVEPPTQPETVIADAMSSLSTSDIPARPNGPLTAIAPSNATQPAVIAADDSTDTQNQTLVPASVQRVTPLHMAAQEGHGDVVRLLLAGGIPIEGRTHKGYTALHLAAQTGQVGVVRILLDHGADVEARELRLWTPLHMAAQDGMTGCLEVLVDVGCADMAAVTCDADLNLTPIHLAALKGHTQCFTALATRGANIHLRSREGHSPLYTAAQNGHRDIVLSILHDAEHTSPATVAQDRTINGFTPLHQAAAGGHTFICSILLGYVNSDQVAGMVRAANDTGWTPLHSAAANGWTDTVRLLIEEFGADTASVTTSNLTALDLAAYGGFQECVEYLLSRTAL